MPGFLGGSDLAVPVGGEQGARQRTGSRRSRARRPRRRSRRSGTSRTRPPSSNTAKVNERAALRSWFVPAAKNWVNVENGNILRTMLAQILTGKLTVKQAAATASDNITYTLNAS